MNAEPMSETKVCDKPAMRDLAEGVLALLGDDCFLVLNERNNENSRLKMKQSIAHAMTKGNVCHDGMKGIFVQPHCDDAKECLFLRFVGEPYVIDIDSSRRVIVCKVRASGLTGLQLEYHEPSTPAAAPQQAALNSLRVRYAPTMLYPPARAAFEAALNSKAKKPGFVGTESRSVYAEATPLRNSGESEPPLNAGELAALRALGGELNPAQVAADAELAAREMMAGLRGKQRRRRDVARNSEAANEGEYILEFESLEIQPGRDKAENCNQHGHDADCTVSITAENLRKTSAGKSLQSVMDELKANPAHPSDIPVTLNQANQRTAEKVQELCGRDISQHVHSISPSELHHARKGHPDLNDEEVMLMLDIHDNWDELTYEVRSNTPKLKYSKTYDGQSYTVVERIGRTPRTKGKTRHLHFTTEFKND